MSRYLKTNSQTDAKAMQLKIGKHKSMYHLKICVQDKNQDGERMHVLRIRYVVLREI